MVEESADPLFELPLHVASSELGILQRKYEKIAHICMASLLPLAESSCKFISLSPDRRPLMN